MALFTTTVQKDRFFGRANVADEFVVSSKTLTVSDVLAGGGPDPGDATDKLTIASSGRIELGFIVNFQYVQTVTGVEEVYLHADGNSIYLSTQLFGSARGYRIEVFGNRGADFVTIGSAYRDDSAVVYGGAGSDTLEGGTGADRLFGGAGNDLIWGKSGSAVTIGSDLLDGGAGNDTIYGSTSQATLNGGSGNDVFDFSNGQVAITIDGGSGFDYITGSALHDSVVFSNIEGLRIGSEFRATIEQLRQFDRIIGSGEKFVGITLTGGGVIDFSTLLQGGRALAVGSGDTGGSPYSYHIVGGSSTNAIAGGDGADTLVGGDSNDKLYGYAGNDLLVGGIGKDLLQGGEGNDRLEGGEGDDDFDLGFSGSDVAIGNAGNDLFRITYVNPQAASTAINGGLGVDTFECFDSLGEFTFSKVEILRPSLRQTFFDARIDQLMSFERIFLGSQIINVMSGGTLNLRGRVGSTVDLELRSATREDVKLFGLDGNDVLRGGMGDDTLIGGLGNDYLDGENSYGGPGNDTISGISGVVDGGSGTDTLELFGKTTLAGVRSIEKALMFNGTVLIASAPTIAKLLDISSSDSDSTLDLRISGGGRLNLAGKTDRAVSLTAEPDVTGLWVTGTNYRDTLVGNNFAETINGAGDRDFITLSGGNDVSDGGGGDDDISGGSGNDSIAGGLGDDFLDGDSEADESLRGNDSLAGGEGNDLLLGGLGHDTLSGDLHNDVLAGGFGADALAGGGGSDTFRFSAFGFAHADKISDFQPADMIALLQFAFEMLPVGRLPAAHFRAGPSAADADDFIVYDASGRLFYDMDGNGQAAAALIATLVGRPALTASDIQVL